MEQENTGATSTQAVRVYDRQGEQAMLAFIMRNERPPGPGGKPEPGCYILEDGSEIWFEGPGGQYRDDQTAEARPQALEPAPHFDLNTPVLEQPSSGSLLDMITRKAENMARLELGLPITRDGLLDLYEVLTTAPGLSRAVRRGMTGEGGHPGAPQRKPALEHLALEHLALEHLEDRCSEAAIRELPESEYRALIDLAREKLGQPAGTERE